MGYQKLITYPSRPTGCNFTASPAERQHPELQGWAIRPDPTIYAGACEVLACAPEQMLMVDDTMEVDAAAPRPSACRPSCSTVMAGMEKVRPCPRWTDCGNPVHCVLLLYPYPLRSGHHVSPARSFPTPDSPRSVSSCDIDCRIDRYCRKCSNRPLLPRRSQANLLTASLTEHDIAYQSPHV